jgi:hypothetical protein
LTRKFVLLISAVLFTTHFNFAQVKTNFEIITKLIDETVSDVKQNLPRELDELTLNFYSSDEYSLLKSKIVSSFQNRNITLVNTPANNGTNLDLTLEDAKIEYTDSFRDGLFGTYLVERKTEINGSYFVTKTGKSNDVIEFEKSYLDTLEYDQIENIENRSIPFTQADPPGEPFFSSLLEPAIALGAAAVTIYLFFTVRTN